MEPLKNYFENWQNMNTMEDFRSLHGEMYKDAYGTLSTVDTSSWKEIDFLKEFHTLSRIIEDNWKKEI